MQLTAAHAHHAVPRSDADEAGQQLADAVRDEEYFLAFLPDGSRLVAVIERYGGKPADDARPPPPPFPRSACFHPLA